MTGRRGCYGGWTGPPPERRPCPTQVGPVRQRSFSSDEARWHSFAETLDEIHRGARARVGHDDLEYVRRVDRFSRRCAALGRALLYLGPGPVSFAGGVGLLWAYKQLQLAEIGHTVLHGALNRVEGVAGYHSSAFAWRAPIDERSWMAGHNGKHHGFTNIHGADPDIDFGYARLTDRAPHRFWHYFQVPLLLLTVPVFSVAINLHFTGVLASSDPADKGRHDRRSPRWRSVDRFLGKFVPYFTRELGLLPLLAGPRCGRVFVGNLLSEGLRDVYTAATVYCGHVGSRVATFPYGARARTRGERYAMQVAASNNFSVPWAVSVLCGGLDQQIEHHLFPTLPPNRLREIAGEVRAACEAHAVPYRNASWPRTLLRAITQICRLSLPSRRPVTSQPEPGPAAAAAT